MKNYEARSGDIEWMSGAGPITNPRPFLQGLIWMRISSFLLALCFLANKKFRQDLFSSVSFNKSREKLKTNEKTSLLFICFQASGGLAGILQSFAISLAPISSLAIMNSLRGVQYIFLFLITLFFSFFFPKILKEDISKKSIIQKTIAIIFIVAGLAVLIS